MEYLKSVGDALVDRSVPELIGAIMVALALALVVAGLYTLGRRKVTDSTMLVTCLTIVASIASMALTGGYFSHLERRRRTVIEGTNSRGFPIPPAVWMEERAARQIMKMADTDGDHSLTTEEAARAAALFVRTEDPNGKGSIDIPALSRSIQNSIIMPVHHDAHSWQPAPEGHSPGPGFPDRPGNPRPEDAGERE